MAQFRGGHFPGVDPCNLSRDGATTSPRDNRRVLINCAVFSSGHFMKVYLADDLVAGLVVRQKLDASYPGRWE